MTHNIWLDTILVTVIVGLAHFSAIGMMATYAGILKQKEDIDEKDEEETKGEGQCCTREAPSSSISNRC